jgi:hypothetical protein
MKIKFTPSSNVSELLMPPPEKASNFLPEWYKNIPSHEPGYDGNKISRFGKGPSLTVKGCNPFLDTLTSGYIFQLAADVEFSFVDGQFIPNWLVDYPLITAHAPHQSEGAPKPFEQTHNAFKWGPGWKISTPKGYSTLFTQPFNRHDLPFLTFSGIVETDTYSVETKFPFQILDPGNKKTIIIEKGTPICQAIPFKRDDWTSEILPYDEKEEAKALFDLSSKLDRSYRNQYWKRKNYN